VISVCDVHAKQRQISDVDISCIGICLVTQIKLFQLFIHLLNIVNEIRVPTGN